MKLHYAIGKFQRPFVLCGYSRWKRPKKFPLSLVKTSAFSSSLSWTRDDWATRFEELRAKLRAAMSPTRQDMAWPTDNKKSELLLYSRHYAIADCVQYIFVSSSNPFFPFSSNDVTSIFFCAGRTCSTYLFSFSSDFLLFPVSYVHGEKTTNISNNTDDAPFFRSLFCWLRDLPVDEIRSDKESDDPLGWLPCVFLELLHFVFCLIKCQTPFEVHCLDRWPVIVEDMSPVHVDHLVMDFHFPLGILSPA